MTALGKPRIVIIEDEFLVASNLQAVLRDLNFGFCEIASDAESGVDLAISQEAELLLVDVNLGAGPDGVEAVRRLREYRMVPAIFITAYTDESNLGRIRQLIPDAPILSKPVPSDLLGATSESCSQRFDAFGSKVADDQASLDSRGTGGYALCLAAVRTCGLRRTHDPSLSHRRPRLGCFIGTFSPSRRQSRGCTGSLCGHTASPATRWRRSTRRFSSLRRTRLKWAVH